MNTGHPLAKIGFLLAAITLLPPTPLAAGEKDPDPLAALFQRSDLIIEATINESVDGGMGGGAINILPRLGYIQCIPRVTINRVLKGDPGTKEPILIGLTLPQADLKTAWTPYEALDLRSVINEPIFSTRNGHPEPPPLLKKGDRWIFFLEDRPRREPGSVHMAGDENIRFRTFDWWFGRVPVSDALIVQLERLNRGAIVSP